MVLSLEKNTGKYHNKKICNKSLYRLEDFKYLVITLLHKNCIHDKNLLSSISISITKI